MMDEYDHFDKTMTCLRAEEINRVFNLNGRERLRPDCAPVFFVGNMQKSRFCLLGLNPAYNEKNYREEREVYKKLGWEATYHTFFDWAGSKISSRYYSRFAVFLACFLSETEIPKDKVGRFQLLGRNLENFNLIPYHSEKFSTQNFNEEQMELIRPYIENLRTLVKMSNPRAIFINGAPFRSVLTQIGFGKISARIPVNKNLQAHIGECFRKPAVWFDKFLTGRSAGPATNEELCGAGRKIREYVT
jgi:hypothetical protein